MPPHPLTYLEIQKYYPNEPRFKGVYSINTFPKIKDGAYKVNHIQNQILIIWKIYHIPK